MIPKECKRLAEVDFPIAEVSRHAVREKSIRHGHPSTLHLWWARRPLASCRAVLMALLLPDPCDEHCPAAFKDAARRVLLRHEKRPRGWSQTVGTDDGLRRVLLKFIADFANWDVAAHPAWLATSRALVKAAHGEAPPLVVDPFAGGGSIPLEALRVGCQAFASEVFVSSTTKRSSNWHPMPRQRCEIVGKLASSPCMRVRNPHLGRTRIAEGSLTEEWERADGRRTSKH